MIAQWLYMLSLLVKADSGRQRASDVPYTASKLTIRSRRDQSSCLAQGTTREWMESFVPGI